MAPPPSAVCLAPRFQPVRRVRRIRTATDKERVLCGTAFPTGAPRRDRQGADTEPRDSSRATARMSNHAARVVSTRPPTVRDRQIPSTTPRPRPSPPICRSVPKARHDFNRGLALRRPFVVQCQRHGMILAQDASPGKTIAPTSFSPLPWGEGPGVRALSCSPAPLFTCVRAARWKVGFKAVIGLIAPHSVSSPGPTARTSARMC